VDEMGGTDPGVSRGTVEGVQLRTDLQATRQLTGSRIAEDLIMMIMKTDHNDDYYNHYVFYIINR